MSRHELPLTHVEALRHVLLLQAESEKVLLGLILLARMISNMRMDLHNVFVTKTGAHQRQHYASQMQALWTAKVSTMLCVTLIHMREREFRTMKTFCFS